jgi:hypothetical protein
MGVNGKFLVGAIGFPISLANVDAVGRVNEAGSIYHACPVHP